MEGKGNGQLLANREARGPGGTGAWVCCWGETRWVWGLGRRLGGVWVGVQMRVGGSASAAW